MTTNQILQRPGVGPEKTMPETRGDPFWHHNADIGHSIRETSQDTQGPQAALRETCSKEIGKETW